MVFGYSFFIHGHIGAGGEAVLPLPVVDVGQDCGVRESGRVNKKWIVQEDSPVLRCP